MALRHYWEPCTVGGHSLPKFLNDDQCSRIPQWAQKNSVRAFHFWSQEWARDREGLKWMGPCSVRGHLLSKFLNDDQCSVHGYHHYVFFCYNCREKRFSKCELLAFPLLDSRNTFLCKFKAEGQKFVIFSRQFSCSRELGKQVTNTFRMVQICATECLILIFLLVSQAYEGDLSKNDSGPKT
jgi:hypothetical protein